MPSVHRQPRTPFWIGHFVGTDGKQVARSTKETDRAKAQAVAERWQREADTLAGRNGPTTAPVHAAPALLERFIQLSQKAQTGELTTEDGQALVSELLAATGQDRLRIESARAYFGAYLAEKLATRAKATTARYRSIAERFLAHLGPRADKPLRSITPRDVTEFREGELARGMSDGSVNISMTFVRAVLEVARLQGVVTLNPAGAVDNLSAAHGERRAFTAEEIDALLAAASPDWQTAILIARGTGFRLSDATGLRWDQFDAERGVIVHRPKKEARHRAAKKRETVCPSDLLAWLRAHQGLGAAPITPTLHGRPTNRKNGLSAEFARLLVKANITVQTVGGSKRKVSDVCFHSLRHTAATEMANAGIGKDVRKAHLGQTSDRVHSGYVHLDADKVRAELDRAAVPRITPRP